jgi:hypothetical protein
MYLPATHRSLANDASGDLTLTSAANEIAAQAPGGVLHAPEFYAAIQDGKIASSIPDDRLRLIFTCCHPALGQMAQVALTLRRFAACRRPTSPGPFSSERRHRMIAHYMSDVNHLLSRERESATTRTANTSPHSRSASYLSPTIVCPRALTGSPVVDSVSRHKPCHGRAAASNGCAAPGLQSYGTKTVRCPMALSAALTSSRAAGRSASTASASIQASLSGTQLVADKATVDSPDFVSQKQEQALGNGRCRQFTQAGSRSSGGVSAWTLRAR